MESSGTAARAAMQSRRDSAERVDPLPVPTWHLATRLAFRFLFAYFLLHAGSALLQLVPLVGGVAGMGLDAAQQPLVVWFGKAVFGLEITVFPNGSGDTTFNWVQLVVHLEVATAAAALWSVLDRRRPSYPWLADALWIGMRFVLAGAMFSYGINKVFGLQFPEPGMQRLLQDYGDSSPMGLMWTFMGASQPYTMFAGWMETIGGLLLCFRRTQLAGALWTAGVMANVFVLNMCYDIPVKIYSFHLLAMALVIAAPDAPRLVRVFLLNRPAPRADLRGPWTNRVLRRTAFGIKLAWVLLTVPLMFWQMSEMRYTYGDLAPRGELDGTWEVAEFRRDGVELPPLETDGVRWRYLTLVDRPDWKQVVVTHMRGVNERWRAVIEDGSIELREMTVAAGADPSTAKLVGTLAVTPDGDRAMLVKGEVEGVPIEARCERREPADFTLMSRGFHWISEYPFNR
jgi:hypothetical protein